MTEVFVEQPLASPGSAKYTIFLFLIFLPSSCFSKNLFLDCWDFFFFSCSLCLSWGCSNLITETSDCLLGAERKQLELPQIGCNFSCCYTRSPCLFPWAKFVLQKIQFFFIFAIFSEFKCFFFSCLKKRLTLAWTGSNTGLNEKLCQLKKT